MATKGRTRLAHNNTAASAPELSKPELSKSDLEMRMSSDERLRLLEDNVRDFAIIELASDGRIAHWNLGAERILGWDEAEIVGQNLSVIFTPEDRASGADAREIEGAVATGRAEDERWHLRRDGTRFWASGILTALRDHQGGLRGFAKILRDQTPQKRAQIDIAEARAKLQADYERERRVAEALQRPLTLEVPEDAFAGLSVATLYSSAWAADGVGGDFFDAVPLSDGRVALLVGDASGKGLTAAARATEVKDVLRALLRVDPYYPGLTLTRLNDYLCDLQSLDDRTHDTFVALSLAVIDVERSEAVLAWAGIEPPILVQADGSVERVIGGGLPLGVRGKELYVPVTVPLHSGDTLVLSTDGLPDARRGREFLDVEGVLRLVTDSLNTPTVRGMGEAILNGARAFAGGALQDDACLVLARRR